MLHSLHSFLSRSSKRLEHLRIWQDILDEPKVKPTAVHESRWLSFANCVSNVRKSLPSLLKTLESDSEDDMMASSLFQAMSTYKFLYLTHFFCDIMGDIATVSRIFQYRDVNYRTIKTTVSAVCDSIEQQYLVEDAKYGNYLRAFLDQYEQGDLYNGIEIKRSHKDTRLPVAVSEFTSLLKDRLLARFPKLELWEAMSIFYPDTFPQSAKDKATFGNEKLARLADHFGGKKGSLDPPIDAEDAIREWPVFKNYMFSASHETGDTTVSFGSITERLVASRDVVDQFPNMTKLIAICRVLPSSSVECERGFSTQNLIKTRLRCSLSIQALDHNMRLSLNGPKMTDFNPVPAFRMWRGRKERHIYSPDRMSEQAG